MANDVLRSADRMRRQAAIWGVLAAVALWILAHVVVVLMKAQPVSTGMNVAQLVAQSIGAGSPIIGFLVYIRLTRTTRLIMWLRRFRSAYGSRLRFHTCLWRAAQALVTPATLQDRSFRSSFMSGFVRAWVFWPLALIGWIIGLLPLLFLLLQAGFDTQVGFTVVVLVWTVLYISLAVVLVRRLGWRTFADLSVLQRSLDRLRSGSGVPFGVEVVKVSDSIWQEAVSAAFRRSDLVLVDVSEPTENVLWELAEGIKLLGPDRVLLVREGSQGSDQVEVVHELSRALDPAVSWPPGTYDCYCLFVYPRGQVGVGAARGKQYKTVSDRLRLVVADSLSRAI